MSEYRKGSHTVYDIQYHFVWVTKYRYHVLRGEVAERARELQAASASGLSAGFSPKCHFQWFFSNPPALAGGRLVSEQ